MVPFVLNVSYVIDLPSFSILYLLISYIFFFLVTTTFRVILLNFIAKFIRTFVYTLLQKNSFKMYLKFK